MDNYTAEKRSGKGNLIIGEIFGKIFSFDPSFHQRGIEIRLQERQRFHIILLQFFHVLFFADLLIQLNLQFGKHIRQFHGIDRLQYVFFQFQMDGFFRVFKLIEPCEEQDLGRRKFCLDAAG